MHSKSRLQRCSEILNAVFRFGRDGRARTAVGEERERERGRQLSPVLSSLRCGCCERWCEGSASEESAHGDLV